LKKKWETGFDRFAEWIRNYENLEEFVVMVNLTLLDQHVLSEGKDSLLLLQL